MGDGSSTSKYDKIREYMETDEYKKIQAQRNKELAEQQAKEQEEYKAEQQEYYEMVNSKEVEVSLDWTVLAAITLVCLTIIVSTILLRKKKNA